MPRDYKPDWVKSSSLSLIPRGLQWFKEFGLEEGVKSIAAEYDRKTINVVDFKTVGCSHRRPIPACIGVMCPLNKMALACSHQPQRLIMTFN